MFEEKMPIKYGIAHLLPAIYEAATNPAGWSGVLAKVVQAMGGNRGAIFTHQATPEQNGLWVFHEIPDECLRLYAEHYHAHDIWMQRGHELGAFFPGNVVTSDDLLPRREFLESEFFRDYLRYQGIYDLCAGVLHDGSEPSVPCVHVAIYRSIDQPPFGADDKARLSSIIGHMREATRIGFLFSAQKRRLDIMEHAVEMIAPAFLLLDASGRVVFTNSLAQTILDRADGIALAAGGFLQVSSAQQAKLTKLQQSISGAGMLRISRTSCKSDYWIVRVAMPIHADQPPDVRRPVVGLMIHDSGAVGEIDADTFARAHGLTPAEGRLLSMLAEHTALPSIARELGISINTARSQLRAVMEKTGAHRQAELVKMLMTWPRRVRASTAKCMLRSIS